MRVCVVNSGSSSVKLRMVERDESVSARADLGAAGPDLGTDIAEFLLSAPAPDAFAHRVVHGGPVFTAPVVVDAGVRASLETLNELAPLHNPPALVAIDALRAAQPGVPSVACFDTAFHATLSAAAATYAVPARWRTEWGVRRYGFHGLSCAWSCRRAVEMLDVRPEALRLVVCHLGSGASVSAIVGGRSVDTTMGFTPLEGLVMATRAGDLDPGVILFALRRGLGLAELDHELEHGSGLAALAAGSKGDMRSVLSLRAMGDEDSQRAVAIYLHRLRSKIAGMAASAGGIDALVFTGGVGENAAAIREECCAGLAWLGVRIEPGANRAVAAPDQEITGRGAAVRTLVVHAREELVMADEARTLLA